MSDHYILLLWYYIISYITRILFFFFHAIICLILHIIPWAYMILSDHYPYSSIHIIHIWRVQLWDMLSYFITLLLCCYTYAININYIIITPPIFSPLLYAIIIRDIITLSCYIIRAYDASTVVVCHIMPYHTYITTTGFDLIYTVCHMMLLHIIVIAILRGIHDMLFMLHTYYEHIMMLWYDAIYIEKRSKSYYYIIIHIIDILLYALSDMIYILSMI